MILAMAQDARRQLLVGRSTRGDHPVRMHLRALVGHAVLGSTTDTVIAALGG
jgi:hypothetical protein